MRIDKIILVIGMALISATLNGTQLKKISSQDGISNNAILSLHQNSFGHIYIGTVDGLNIWNGHSMEIFQAADGYNYFFGNQVKYIFPYKSDELLLLTTYGLAELNMKTREVKFHKELAFTDRITIDQDGNVFGIKNRTLVYFNLSTREYIRYPEFKMPTGVSCHRLNVLSDGNLCILTSADTYILTMKKSDNGLTIQQIRNLGIKCRFAAACFDGRHNYIITHDDRLCMIDIRTAEVSDISSINFGSLKEDYISGIIPAEKGYYISFMQNGLYFLPKGENVLQTTGIECGVFSMIPDKKQPIIWVGTDCNGLIRWCDTATDITSITYEQLPYSIEMPVRSLYLDKKEDLWIGTKGDGLYRIRKFDSKGNFDASNTDRFTTENSFLPHNTVYAMKESRHNMFWIGTEGSGLGFMSHDSGKIGRVKGSGHFSLVHDIIEENDSTLWIATDGKGAYRCNFRMRGNNPEITRTDTLVFSEPFQFNTSIFSMAFQNDSTIWFGSRGKGVLSYNVKTRSSRIIQFTTEDGFAANETFYVSGGEEMLFATGNGLAGYNPQNDSVFISKHVPNRAIHSIIRDDEGNIWVASNSGIISLDSELNYRSSFDRFSGMEVLEYSDGACYFDSRSKALYFGGINGFTIIKGSLREKIEYNPEINITDFIQNNEYSHIGTKMKNGKLRLPYSKSIFAIRFSVVDNLNYSDYQFSYNIEGHNKEWTINNSSTIYMPSLNPGHYTLRIRYLNQATLYQSEECCLPIYIIPPFYLRWWALMTYALLLTFFICKIVQHIRYKYEKMREKIRKQHSDEVMKIKSETTNTITEELSVQITFILGLCQQIRQQTQNNSLVADKVNLVEYNIAKINRILHILNEYKNLSETVANSKEVALVPISQLAQETLELISANTKTRKVALLHDIEPDIIMATSKEAFLTIFNSLLYKVISMASGSKEINLKIAKKEHGGIKMYVKVSTEKQNYLDFAEAFESNEMRNEFEVTLFSKLVTDMNGSIRYSYDHELHQMVIKISLPQHNVRNDILKFEDSHISENINNYNSIVENLLPEKFKTNSRLDCIYLISSKKDISSFLGYFLASKYNILTFSENEPAMDMMKNQNPVAIIYDVSSMISCFSDFMEKMKEMKRASQIPVIALTSAQQIAAREECIKIGADLCISFPFNIEYLNSALEKILHKRESIAEYYKSPISTYIIEEGKIIHQDDKIFLNKVMSIINDHISDSAFTAADIASELGMSIRVMYRKLEGITDRNLHLIIRESRMELAAKLLSSSKLTIDETMYKVGYDNRSTFYRNFKESFGMTPKEYRGSIRNDVMKSLSNNTETDKTT